MKEVASGNQAEINNPILPQFEYDYNLLAPDCPYEIEIDPSACAGVLRLAGINDPKIAQTTIRLMRQPYSGSAKVAEAVAWGGKFMGKYKPEEGAIEIYTDAIWNSNQKLAESLGGYHWLSERAQKISADSSPLKRLYLRQVAAFGRKVLFSDFSAKERFADYLENSPDSADVDAIISRMTNIRMNRSLNETLTHEAKHVAQTRLGRIKNRLIVSLPTILGTEVVATLGVAIVHNVIAGPLNPEALYIDVLVGFPFAAAIVPRLAYQLDRMEVEARRFSKNNSRSVDAIGIYPKQSNE